MMCRRLRVAAVLVEAILAIGRQGRPLPSHGAKQAECALKGDLKIRADDCGMAMAETQLNDGLTWSSEYLVLCTCMDRLPVCTYPGGAKEPGEAVEHLQGRATAGD
ncbi:hypothetical protein GGI35DRAFT_169431 [Trichoderma velutinum]